MARTPMLERSGSLKILGAAFIAMLVLFVYLTYAVFTKKFVDYDAVTLKTDTTGVNLPQNADVKLRGMIVGEVRKVEPDGDGVKLLLAMKPDLINEVPQGVTAQLIPKTLFGEKYVALIPPAQDITGGAMLKAGDTITKANVPIEVETLLNDLYPLLTAVDPVNLSYTLSAVSTALEGRGTKLGTTLVTLNDYLLKANPDVPQLIDDVKKLGTVSDTYAAAIPDLGRLLRNAVVTGNTIVAKKSQLTAFFDEGTRLSKSLTDFTDKNGDNLITLAHEGRPVLELLDEYSSTFPCFLGAMSKVIPRLDNTFRDGQLHIEVEIIEQPDQYADNERLDVRQSDLDEASTGRPAQNGTDIRPDNAAAPTCLDLNDIRRGDESASNQDDPFQVPASVYKLIDVKTPHAKFDDDGKFRSAASSTSLQDLVQPSIQGIDSPGERSQLNTLLGASLGMSVSEVPDIGSLMISPVLRGSDVTAR